MSAPAERSTPGPEPAPLPANAFPFTCTERVRWEDVDLAGIVRYSAFTRMLDVAEQEMWRTIGFSAVSAMERFGVWLPRRKLEIVYHAPARFDDLLELRAAVAAVGNSSVQVVVDVWSADGSVRHVTIRVVLVVVAAEVMQPRPVPAELRALLESLRLRA